MTKQEQDNEEVLERMRSHGDLLVQSRPITFTLIFPDESCATEFAKVATDLAGKVDVHYPGAQASSPWDVHVTRDMVPTNAAISKFETRLQRAAEPYRGENDGWYSVAINFPYVPRQ